jgi:anhydro-N-acetylmuramic acid kinase
MKSFRKASIPIVALGTMSGTSLDSLDAAVLVTDGYDITVFGPTQYRRRTDSALGHWSGPEVEAARSVIYAFHAEALAKFEGIDLVGFHGQTLACAPRKQGTLQMGDGAALAEHLKTHIIWDFRSSDVELGGDGAPLTPFFHHACARYIKAEGPILFLNLGGMGNIKWLDPAIDAP